MKKIFNFKDFIKSKESIKDPLSNKESSLVRKIIKFIDDFMGISDGVKISKVVRDNAKIALSDIRSGKVYTDDKSAENLSNVLKDILKGSFIGFVYLLPGSMIPFTLLRKMLRSSKSEKIRKILELTAAKTVEENSKKKDEDK